MKLQQRVRNLVAQSRGLHKDQLFHDSLDSWETDAEFYGDVTNLYVATATINLDKGPRPLNVLKPQWRLAEVNEEHYTVHTLLLSSLKGVEELSIVENSGYHILYAQQHRFLPKLQLRELTQGAINDPYITHLFPQYNLIGAKPLDEKTLETFVQRLEPYLP